MESVKTAIDYGVIGILILMSVASFGIAIERFFFLRSVKEGRFRDRRELEIELTRGLHLLATIGFNAPYVGLLGTVLGIMLTFYRIGAQGFVDTKEIMVGLALALKATAVGLVVAIPSVAFYNLLLRKVKVIIARWESKNGR